MQTITTNFKKILLIQTAFLGDVIMTTPLVRGLREIFPDAEISVITTPASAVFFKYNPHVQNIYTFDKKQFFRKWVNIFKLVRLLRREHFELALSAHLSLTTSLLLILAGISTRVGFVRQRGLTHPIQLPEKGMHNTRRYVHLLSLFGYHSTNTQTELFWSKKEDETAVQFLSSLGENPHKKIGIAPGSVWATKRWPLDYFIQLLQSLTDNEYQFVFLGGPEDRELCDRIITQSGQRALNGAGVLNLLESAAVMEKLDLIISNDSAPLHMANAVRTAVFAFFGPTVQRFGCFPIGPEDQVFEVDLYCRPCAKHGSNTCPEGHFRCMMEIKPEMAAGKVLQFFNKPIKGEETDE
jgi:heptosyltransferase II